MPALKQTLTRLQWLPSACLALFLLYYAASLAWTQEDINISLRVVENVLHGYGLRWNTDERVQVYTHPLWLLLLIPLSAFFEPIFPASAGLPMFKAMYWSYLTLSLLCLSAMLALLLHHFRRAPLVFAGFLLIPFLATRAFMDYTSSGLENPLAYALIAFLVHAFFQLPTRNNWCLRAFLYSCLILTRMDLALLFAPAFACALWPRRRNLPFAPLLLGILPLLAWWLFCLVYYGQILPNTYYAKLSNTFPREVYISHGLIYLTDFTLASITGAIMLALGALMMLLRPYHLAPLLSGAMLYVAYIISVGGDYMSGRFFTFPFTLTALALAYDARENPGKLPRACMAVLLLASLYARPWQPDTTMHHTGDESIWNERYLRLTTCFFCSIAAPQEKEPWSVTGMTHRARAAAMAPNKYIVLEGSMGLIGLFSGPQVIILDGLRITDPFMARLPVVGAFRIGHLQTFPPPGYVEARATGNINALPDNLRPLYTHIHLLASAPLWSAERWKAIFSPTP